MIREKKQSEHLLDYLTREAGLSYLSDLCWNQKGCRDKLIDILTRLPAGQATEQEWNNALAYNHRETIRTARRRCQGLFAGLFECEVAKAVCDGRSTMDLCPAYRAERTCPPPATGCHIY